MNFILGLIIALILVHVLVIVPAVGILAANMEVLFGVVVPYAAVTIFLVGLLWRVTKWGRSAVPFRIPTTAGQQKTLPWIKDSKLDNPTTTAGVVGRMLLEILLFRSLFRNTRMEYREGPRITYEWEKWLWLFALLFHYSFLVVLLRHLRFFAEPVPLFVQILESLDGFAQAGIAPLTGWGLPNLLLSGVVLPGAATLLLLRRLWVPSVRYISLPGDFFPLLLIIGIATTGILMRYVFKLDVVGVKQLMMGLVTFHPVVPPGHRGPVLHAPVPGVQPLRLFPLQQAGAPRRNFPEPHAQPGQQQPDGPPRQSLELPGKGPHLRRIRRRIP